MGVVSPALSRLSLTQAILRTAESSANVPRKFRPAFEIAVDAGQVRRQALAPLRCSPARLLYVQVPHLAGGSQGTRIFLWWGLQGASVAASFWKGLV